MDVTLIKATISDTKRELEKLEFSTMNERTADRRRFSIADSTRTIERNMKKIRKATFG